METTYNQESWEITLGRRRKENSPYVSNSFLLAQVPQKRRKTCLYPVVDKNGCMLMRSLISSWLFNTFNTQFLIENIKDPLQDIFQFICSCFDDDDVLKTKNIKHLFISYKLMTKLCKFQIRIIFFSRIKLPKVLGVLVSPFLNH